MSNETETSTVAPIGNAVAPSTSTGSTVVETKAPKAPKAKKAAAAKAPKVAKVVAPAKRGPTSKVDPAMRIVKVAGASNPRRAGSLAAERWSLYRDGQTVANYLAKCDALEPGRTNKDGTPFDHRVHVRWDLDRTGTIRLVTAEEWQKIDANRKAERPAKVAKAPKSAEVQPSA
jgi:hypothetical protein